MVLQLITVLSKSISININKNNIKLTKMKKIKTYSVTRSNTKQQLPNINPKTPRLGILPKNRSYFGDLAKQFSINAQYDDMDHLNISKQQRKLKDVLRKMNDETVKIIADYTPRSKKVQKHHLTTTSILAIKDKQVQNNHKIMSQCQIQIQKLIARVQGLTQKSKQIYDHQLASIQDQIQIAKQQNKILQLEIGKTGNNIITQNRIIQEGQMRRLQYDVYLAEHKANHLRADDQRVQQQIKQYQRKLRQINQKAIFAERFFKQQQKKLKQKQTLMSNQYQLIHKKVAYQNIKKKSDFYNQNYQYRYLSLLRQLDQATTSIKQVQSKIDKSFVSIQASKMIINKFQAQLQNMKKKRKERQFQVNQFLRKNKNNQDTQKQKNSRIQNLEHREMPSQISVKQELAIDNSLELQELIEQKIPGQQKQVKKQAHRSDILLNS